MMIFLRSTESISGKEILMYYKNYIYFILNLYNVVDKQKFKSYTNTVNRPTLQSGVIGFSFVYIYIELIKPL